MDQVREYGLPLVVEPSGPEAVIADGIDLLYCKCHEYEPVAVDSWQTQRMGTSCSIPWDRVVQEAYIVMNPASSVARVTGSDCSIPAKEVAAYAEIADHFFQFPNLHRIQWYIREPGSSALAADAISNSVLYYGGGIDSGTKAAEMAKYADTIVVGNAVYEKGVQTLIETVQAIQ